MSGPLLTVGGIVPLLTDRDRRSTRATNHSGGSVPVHALMTPAVEPSTLDQQAVQHTVSIVILGTDAVLAAQPASPVQLAHACLRAGFSNVLPASWGDELIASAVLRRLPQFGTGPVIQCSCPIVAHRLLNVGGDLRPALLALVPPPVAVARYVHELAQPAQARITYVGNCPGAVDASIDIRMTPAALITMLAERDIRLSEQPQVFESVIPADRRRFRSQPGGLPAAEALWTEIGARTIAELEGDDLVADLAQHLLTGKNVLIDASARLGCVCAGAVAGTTPHHARAVVSALEPPRASAPVVDEHAYVELDLPVPAISRSPVDVIAVPPVASSPRQFTPPRNAEAVPHRNSPPRGVPVQPEARPEIRPARASGPTAARPVLGATPIARQTEGKSLPRAYVARRRQSPRKNVPAPPAEPVTQTSRAPDLPRPKPASHVLAPEPMSGAAPTAATVVVAPELAAQTAYTPPLKAKPHEPPQSSPQPIEEQFGEMHAVSHAPVPSRHPRPASLDEPEVATHERIVVTPAHPATLPLRHLLLILIAVVGVAVGVSTVVALIIGRSTSAPPSATPVERDFLH